MKLKRYLQDHNVSQSELARKLDVTQGMVWQWINNKRRVSAERVLDIEKATDGLVSRHELRPDLYPQDHAA